MISIRDVKWLALSVFSVSMILLFQNCSGGGGGAGAAGNTVTHNAAGLGTFVDDPVAGLSYTTSSGLSGVTNAQGQFNFNPGDSVTFYALGVKVGTATPSIGLSGNTTLTPLDLVPNNTGVTDPAVTSIAQFLNTLNAISVGIGTNSAGSGVFAIPTSSTLQGQFNTGTSASTLTQSEIQSALNAAFGAGTYTVTAASAAQSALQSGLNAQPFIGTVWRADCTGCHGAYVYLNPNGSISGVTDDGNALAGTWVATSSTSASFTVIATGGGSGGATGTISSSGTGSGQVTDGSGDHALALTEISSSAALSASSYIGYWYVVYTPNAYGISLGDNQGGCANVVAGPGTFYGVTNGGQSFSGSISGSGVGSASFSDGNGKSNNLNFDLSTQSGTDSENGQVKGSLTFSRTGSCQQTSNGGGGNGSGNVGTGTTSNGTGGTGMGTTSAGMGTTSNSSLLNNSTGVQVHMFISWANTANSANSIVVELQGLDQNGNPVGNITKSETDGGQNNSGVRFTTQDDIVVNFNIGTAATYRISVGVSPCTLSYSTGSVGADDNVTYPAVTITCN